MKKRIPLVSVIIPTFGRPDYICRCIDSVLNQTYKNIEIIVIDDNGVNSTNQIDTNAILKKYLSSDCIVYKVLDHNSGGSIARNTGINLSNGDYLTFLDDDDEFLPNKIEMQLDSLLSNEVDISLCGAIYLDDNEHIEKYKGLPSGNNISDFLLKGRALTPMIFVKKEFVVKVSGFEETPRFQDHIFMLKLLAEGAKVHIIDIPLYKCYRHSGIRISKTPKSYLGYKKKHQFENKFSYFLSPDQLKTLKFNQRLDLYKFHSSFSIYKEFIHLLKMDNSRFFSILRVYIKILIGRDKV